MKYYKKKYSHIQPHKLSQKTNKYKTDLCDDKMDFQECEIAILRHAVDETEKIQGQNKVNSKDIQEILKIVEKFIIQKKLICYGGTAINNILPKSAQFYNRELEIPDYDFFSPDALEDAKELADIYYKEGYVDTEAKSGVHMGTFKVFVNFIPIADITYMHKDLYKAIGEDAVTVLGMKYAPPNYLRMAMYLELSRPAGDVSRWEKVMKRLNLLNEHYPLITKEKCHKMDFHKQLTATSSDENEKIYYAIRDSLIDQEVVFFGGYAMSLYMKYAINNYTSKLLNEKTPVFDVLSVEPEKCATIISEQLSQAKVKNIKVVKHPAFYEIIPEHFEIRIGKQSMAFVYAPIACHSYNTITINEKKINVATIDTILTFYLSFTYVDLPYYNKNRLLCMATLLFDVEQQNRLEQRGLLKRFSIECYGKQPSLEDIRAEKAAKYEELKSKRNTREYEMWFLKYVPDKLHSKHPSKKLLSSNAGDEKEDEVDAEDDKTRTILKYNESNEKPESNIIDELKDVSKDVSKEKQESKIIDELKDESKDVSKDVSKQNNEWKTVNVTKSNKYKGKPTKKYKQTTLFSRFFNNNKKPRKTYKKPKRFNNRKSDFLF